MHYLFIYLKIYIYLWVRFRALLKFDGDFAPEFGTPPADIVSENYPVLPIYLCNPTYSVPGTGLASFKPMYTYLKPVLRTTDVLDVCCVHVVVVVNGYPGTPSLFFSFFSQIRIDTVYLDQKTHHYTY
jgi:hypothetical protein